MRVWGCHLVTSDDFNLIGLNQEVKFLRLKVSFVRVLWEALTWHIMEELPELWKKPDFLKKTWAYNYKLHRAVVSRASVRYLKTHLIPEMSQYEKENFRFHSMYQFFYMIKKNTKCRCG